MPPWYPASESATPWENRGRESPRGTDSPQPSRTGRVPDDVWEYVQIRTDAVRPSEEFITVFRLWKLALLLDACLDKPVASEYFACVFTKNGPPAMVTPAARFAEP